MLLYIGPPKSDYCYSVIGNQAPAPSRRAEVVVIVVWNDYVIIAPHYGYRWLLCRLAQALRQMPTPDPRSDDIFPRIDEGMEGMMKIDVLRVAR